MSKEDDVEDVLIHHFPYFVAYLRPDLDDRYREIPGIDDLIAADRSNDRHRFLTCNSISNDRNLDFDLRKALIGGEKLSYEMTQNLRAYIASASDFFADIRDLTYQELYEKFQAEIDSAQQRRAALRFKAGQQNDKNAFFNRRPASAGLASWFIRVPWTAEEATALSFGKNPEVVNVKSLDAYRSLPGSPFRDEFKLRLDRIQRAIDASVLGPRISPKKFCEWAQRVGIDVDVAVKNAFVSSDEKEHVNDKATSVNRLHKTYGLLLGLIIKHYGFDPTLPIEQQNEILKLIYDDVIYKLGVKLTDKTLLKIVSDAASWARQSGQKIANQRKLERRKDV